MIAVVHLLASCSYKRTFQISKKPDQSALDNIPVVDDGIRKRSELLHNYLLGELAYERQDTEGAIFHLNKASGALLKPVQSLHQNLAMMHFKTGQLDEALIEIEKELAVNSKDWEAQYLKAAILIARGEVEAVRAYYELSQSNNTKRPEPVVQLYRLACFREQAGVAARHAKTMRKKFNAAARILGLLEPQVECVSVVDLGLKVTLFYLQLGQSDEALRELYLLGALQPNNSQVKLALANTYAGLGRKQEAIRELLDVSEEDALYVRSRTLAAFYARQEEQFDRAKDILYDAWVQTNESRDILPFYAAALKDAGKIDESLKLLEDQLKLDSFNADLWYEYALMLHQAGRISDSISAVEKVIEINPDHAAALNHMAYTLAEEGQDLDRAESLIKKALQLVPGDSSFIDTLGWIYFKQGKYQLAEVELKKAVELSNSEWVIVEHYADVLVELGRASEALELYRQALEQIYDRDFNDAEAEAGKTRLNDKIKNISE